MTTITALNVRLGMDASNFTEGANLTRAEVNKVAATMRQSVPPAEKYKREVETLNKAFSAAGRQSKEYANALEFLKRKHGQGLPGIKSTTGGINQLGSSMLSAVPGGHVLGGAMTGVAGAALAAAAAVAVAAREIAKAAERIDETAKAARSLGLAYGDLVAIQMQAGEVAGLDSESVNRGLGQFVRRLAEARVNGGKLEETMRSVGLSVEDLAAMNPADAFKAVSNAIAGIPDKAEQVRIATELVGKEGVKMVELFRAGGDGISDMKKEAERLGLALKDDVVKSVESMNDAWGRSKKASEGMWNQVTVALAPVLTEVAKLVEQLFVSFRESSGVVGGLGDALKIPLWLIEKMVQGFRFIVAAMSDMRKASRGDFSFSETARVFKEMDEKANGVAAGTKSAAAHAEALAIEVQRAAEETAKVQESFEKQVEALEIERLKLEGNIELARQMELAAQGYSEEQQAQLMSLEDQNQAIRDRTKAEEEAKKQTEKNIEAAKKAAMGVVDTLAKGFEEVKKELEELDKAFEMEVDSAMQAAQQFFEQERQRDSQMRDRISSGPGAGMEVGSSEAAKFMADQVNAAIGSAAMPERPTPGEKEIADKTRELLLEQRAANAEQAKQSQVMRDQLAELKQNRFSRVRA